MDFYLGVFFGACFFLCLFLAVKIGQKVGQKQREDMRAKVGAMPVPASEEERRKAERMKEGFNQLMSYDVTTALGKKVH